MYILSFPWTPEVFMWTVSCVVPCFLPFHRWSRLRGTDHLPSSGLFGRLLTGTEAASGLHRSWLECTFPVQARCLKLVPGWERPDLVMKFSTHIHRELKCLVRRCLHHHVGYTIATFHFSTSGNFYCQEFIDSGLKHPDNLVYIPSAPQSSRKGTRTRPMTPVGPRGF